MKTLSTVAAVMALGFLGIAAAHADSDLAAKDRADAAASAAQAKMKAADAHPNSPEDIAAHKAYWAARQNQIKLDKAFWAQRHARINNDVATAARRTATEDATHDQAIMRKDDATHKGSQADIAAHKAFWAAPPAGDQPG